MTICTQVLCDGMNDRMYAVYVLRSKVPTNLFLCGVCIQLILHGEYMPVAEACNKV